MAIKERIIRKLDLRRFLESGIDTGLMCDKHILGEHAECHMFVGCLNKGKSVEGYVNGGLVELDKIGNRHEELVKEMERRGFKHQSPIDSYVLFEFAKCGKIDVQKNIEDLKSRCENCRVKMEDK
jgi:hypothetical protein